MKARLTVSAILILGTLAGCSLPHTDLTSPCVGNDGSPCGPRRPVNDWWLKNHDQNQPQVQGEVG